MKHPEIAWAATIGGLVATDYWVSKRFQDATLSCAARRTFRVHTKPGRILFIGGWVVLSAWLIPHIIQPNLVSEDDWTEK